MTDCISDPGTQWVCLSAGERQALEWLKKAKEWTIAYQMSLLGEEHLRDGAEALLKSAEIRFPNGSSIMAIPANPSTARGYSCNVVLDEFAYHEKPDTVWSAMFPSQTNPLANTFLAKVQAMREGKDFESIQRQMKIRMVSTFNGQDNKFYRLWERRSSKVSGADADMLKHGHQTPGSDFSEKRNMETGGTPILRFSEKADMETGKMWVQPDTFDSTPGAFRLNSPGNISWQLPISEENIICAACAAAI